MAVLREGAVEKPRGALATLQRKIEVSNIEELRTLDASDATFEGCLYTRHRNPDGSLGGFVEHSYWHEEIDNSATIAYDAVIRCCTTIRAGAEIGADTIIGAEVYVGENAKIGSHVEIGYRAAVGNNAIISDQVIISEFVNLMNNVVIDGNATIQRESILRDNVSIGCNTTIGERSWIDEGITIGHDVVIGSEVEIHSDATIKEGARIGGGNVIKSKQIVENGDIIEETVDHKIKTLKSEYESRHKDRIALKEQGKLGIDELYSERKHDQEEMEHEVHTLIRQELEKNEGIVFRGYHFRTNQERDRFALKTSQEGLICSSLAELPIEESVYEGRGRPIFNFMSFSASENAAKYFAKLDIAHGGVGAVVKIRLDALQYRLVTYGPEDYKDEDFEYAWLAEVRVNQKLIPKENIVNIDLIN